MHQLAQQSGGGCGSSCCGSFLARETVIVRIKKVAKIKTRSLKFARIFK